MTLTQLQDMWAVGSANGLLPAEAAQLRDVCMDDPLARACDLATQLARSSPSEISAAIDSLTVSRGLRRLKAGEVEGALRTYAFLATRLIHSDVRGRGRHLPRTIAQPLLELSQTVGRPPGLTYASYVLTNWLKPPAPRSKPDDIAVALTFSDTLDEEWFIAVHLAVETVGGEVVEAFTDCRNALDADDTARLVGAIDALAEAINWSGTVLERIEEHVDAAVFRDVVRPNLHGFAGVMFEVDPPLLVSYVGETGAQSGLIHAIDLALAIRHSAAIEHSLARFRECAPPQHREYMAFAAAIGRQIASLARSDNDIRKAYLRALAELHFFRDRHVRVVEHFLLSGTRGTGGTSGHPWLQSIRDDVARTAATIS